MFIKTLFTLSFKKDRSINIMEFKRHEGFLSRYNIVQKKFDKELLVCPFCGEFPHWYLNVQNGFSVVKNVH